MVRFSFALAAVTAGAVVAATGQAAPIDLTNPATSATIAQILAQPGPDSGKFIVFDKLFMINSFTPGTGTPAAFNASNVLIAGRNNGVDGAGFRLFNQWADFPGDNVAFGFTFDYDVTILPAFQALGYKIVGVNLASNVNAAGDGSIASVDETVFQGAVNLGNLRVFADGTGGLDQSDMLAVPMTVTLNAIKDFKLFSPTPGGHATASFIEQTFKQIPAPAAAPLMLMGLGAIARRRR